MPENNWVWSPQGVIDMHHPEHWGFLQLSGKLVGTGEEAFQLKQQEKIKWVLRQLYYRQRKYHHQHQHYAGSLQQLQLRQLECEGKVLQYDILASAAQYEIAIQGPNSPVRWHINQFGRTWSTLQAPKTIGNEKNEASLRHL